MGGLTDSPVRPAAAPPPLDRITNVFGSLFGVGHLPWAPGTWATFVVIGAAWFLPAGIPWQVGTTGAFFVACFATLVLGTVAEQTLGREDPGFIVLDEAAGSLVALAGLSKPEPWWFLGAFVLFRIFDVLKPWPCRRLERLPGGVGILADDLMAGFYAWLSLVVIRTAVPGLN